MGRFVTVFGSGYTWAVGTDEHRMTRWFSTMGGRSWTEACVAHATSHLLRPKRGYGASTFETHRACLGVGHPGDRCRQRTRPRRVSPTSPPPDVHPSRPPSLCPPPG